MRYALAAIALVASAAVGVAIERGNGRVHDVTPLRARPAPRLVRRLALVRRGPLTERSIATLPAPLQDPSPAVLGNRLVLAGGLTASDTSTSAIVSVTGHSARTIGQLPTARHDTAAATLAGAVYVFGGGNGVAQLDDILRVDGNGHASRVGALPAASSDSTAAALGGTAYVVGGYTGTRWLDTIVAWRPGTTARVVAHLPHTVRYAAVAATRSTLVIAGGSLEDGSASRTVYAFDPRTHRVHVVGLLPQATTHAAAAALGDKVYVIGGRGAALGTPTATIVEIDPAARKVRADGTLSTARSDLAAGTVGGHIVVAGGHSSLGTVATVSTLVTQPRATSSAHTIDHRDVYAHDRVITGAARTARSLIYVPNSRSDTVDVIDPRTRRIVEHFPVGGLPQHVVPSWDLRTLYVTNDTGNSLTAIDPQTGKPGRTIPVDDPYNMYFTPDGSYAIVVAERLHRLDFRDAHTFALHHSVPVPCTGVDHIDFSADERYLLASCEFSGQIVRVDVVHERVTGVLTLPDGASGMPQDVKLAPNGAIFYVADMMANGLWEIDGKRLKVVGFLHTGRGVHGLYPSRDGREIYATNRGEGSISVIDVATRKVARTWRIPGGGSPDMGGVSADGKILWVSGRYNGVVYAISTRDGRLLAKIPVGLGPHGLCVWPQPGRYSLGHTGILR